MSKSANAGLSALGSALIWFGAAVSIAEMEAGADLHGFVAGGGWGGVLKPMLAGHLLGGALLFLAAWVGGCRRKGAMDCARDAFGRLGGVFFAVLNILQLVGWTAVMIAQGASAAAQLLPGSLPGIVPPVAIGILVALWLYVGLKGVGRLNAAAMGLLFALTVALCAVMVRNAGSLPRPDLAKRLADADFWTVFELSAAMPLSWLPLAADYTQDARRPFAAALAAALVYTLVSCWMYAIGLFAAAHGGLAGAFRQLGAAAFAIPALAVVVFSTVTTTFLDAYSAGESARSVFRCIPARPFGVLVVALGVALALAGVMDGYMSFLYLVASVFAPMGAAWLAHALLRRSGSPAPLQNFAAWLSGFALYHACLGTESPVAAVCPALEPLLSRWNSPVGATIPSMALAAIIALLPFPRPSADAPRD